MSEREQEKHEFLERHHDADEIIVEARTGAVVGAVYRTSYGRHLGEVRAFLHAAGAVSEDDEGLTSIRLDDD